MRVFIPATLEDLLLEKVPARQAIVPEVTFTGAEAVEVAEFEATEDASILSLEILRETEQKPARRVVLAADVTSPDETLSGLNWNKIKAILVDGPEAEPFVEAVYAARTQAEADDAVSEVLECVLEWYALEEKKLLQRLVITEA